MRQSLRGVLPATVLFLSAGAWAQETAAPAKLDITAEQVIEKSIEATGGRKAFEGMKSSYAKGTFELPALGATGQTEIWAKAPNKQLSVTTVEGFGEVKSGCDGQVAWTDNPEQGLVVLEGEAAAVLKREATFNGVVKWKELYPKTELKGKQKLEDRDVFVIELTPAGGKPVTHYYDAENFLLLRSDMVFPTMEGMNTVQTTFADYKEVEGRKAPHTIKQNLPVGEIIVKLTEWKWNVEIDNAKFAKPGETK